MLIKKTLVVSVLLFSLVHIKAGETQNIAALVMSLSPDLPNYHLMRMHFYNKNVKFLLFH